MRVLIVDNNILPDCWGSEELQRCARATSGLTIVTRRGPHSDLPASPQEFDAVVVSGSMAAANAQEPWIDDLLGFIRRTIDARKPYLGVCFGHQMLARAVGGIDHVRRAEVGEFGWTEIVRDGQSKLFDGLSRTFFSFSHHHDEVHVMPKGFRKIAHSAECGVQGIEMESQPVFGIQFHPEKNLQDAKDYFTAEMKDRKRAYRLSHPKRSDELFDPSVSEKIFNNFFKSTA